MLTKNLRGVVNRLGLLLPLLLVLVLVPGCGAPGENSNSDGTDDVPCSCAVGAKRCSGTGIQVCEASSDSCASWGPAVACPDGACQNGACPGSCSDTCPGGTTRCGSDSEIETCRIGGTGCLEWVRQSCPMAQRCDATFCKAAVPCDSGCPSGYLCSPSGVCAGGKPDGLVLNVQSVHIGGKVTLNGAAPMLDPRCAANPTYATAHVKFTELTKGYSFTFTTQCKDSGFAFSGDIYPGTYRVDVDGAGTYSDVPDANFIANPGLAITAAVNGLSFNVQTVQLSGKVTLNGAAPMLDPRCAANPTYVTAHVKLTDSARGYSFSFNTLCKDSGFAFSGPIYPGVYSVAIDGAGTYSDVPTPNFVYNPSLPVAADLSGLVVNVQTVKASGKVTLNGAAPMPEAFCTANPTAVTAHVKFREATKGYSFQFNTLCKDPGFAFTGELYPGTYSVSIDGAGTYSDVPTANFVANPALAVAADVSGLLLDVRTVRLSAKLTLNGTSPTLDAFCAANPTAVTAHVKLTDAANGYSFQFNTLCKDSGFTFSGDIFPGTYQVAVDGTATYSDVPAANYIARTGLAVAADVSGLVFNIQTLRLSGKVTLNGAAPILDAAACATNPTYATAHVKLTDPTRGYYFTYNTFCKDSGFAFSGAIYPGTYIVAVDGAGTYSDVPAPNFVYNPSLVVAADVSGLVVNVQTLRVGGRVTLNGITPMLDPRCAANPTYVTSHVTFSEPTKGYLFTFNTLCKDSSFAFTGDIYPGTYAVKVDGAGTYSDVPPGSYVAVTRILLP